MNEYNRNSFFKKGEIGSFNEMNLDHKIIVTAYEILLKSEKNVEAG